MDPTPQQIAAIRVFVETLPGGWTNSDGQICAAMAGDLVPNPAAQGTVPKPYTAAALLALLSEASAANLYAFPAIHQLFADISAQDSAAVGSAVGLLEAAGKITPDEAAAINAAITATEPDPAWTATVPWDVANLGRAADYWDVKSARV